MTRVAAVLDTSAVLAYVLDEAGAGVVEEAIRRGAAISTVNVAEFCAKLSERQVSARCR